MRFNLKMYGCMIIAAVLLLAVVGAGTAGADGVVQVWNGTGLQELRNGDSVHGGNGYAHLTVAGDTCTLELNNFNVTNTGAQIISSTVPDLTIVLNGNSNLAGSYISAFPGLIGSTGNLTITKGADGSRLVVNNTNCSTSPIVTAINAVNLTIDNAAVTAIANNTGKSLSCALEGSNTIRITGSDAVVDAYATSVTSGAHPVMANERILITSFANVTTTAEIKERGNAHGLYTLGGGSIVISDSAEVTAIATATIPDGSAYPISCLAFSQADIIITNAKVTATADGNKEAFALVTNNGGISISGENTVVDAKADSAANRASAIRAKFYSAGTGCIDIRSAAVHASANSTSADSMAGAIWADQGIDIATSADVTAAAFGTNNAFALRSESGNLAITGSETVVDAEAVSDTGNSVVVYGNGELSILPKKITAVGCSRSGNATSFAYNSTAGSRTVIGLEKGYTFSNATVSGAEPMTYQAFTSSSNWVDNEGSMISKFTSVEVSANVTTVGFTGTTFTGQKVYSFGQAADIPALPSKDGIVYSWNVTEGGNLTDETYVKNGKWIYAGANDGTLTVYEHAIPCTNTTKADEMTHVAEFHKDNLTAINEQTYVSHILLENVSNVKGEVTFGAAGISAPAKLPHTDGYTQKSVVTVFDITAAQFDRSADSQLNVTVQLKNANKNDVKFWHCNATTNAWEKPALKSEIIADDGTNVTYKVNTSSFSPFGITIETVDYVPSSSSKQTGYTQILLEGQEVPTVTPTPTPTDTPGTPVVNPTTQPTQASPAPIAGLIGGLGAAALVLTRLRR